MKQLSKLILMSLILANWSLPINSAPLPQKINSCADSFVQRKIFHFSPSPGDPDYVSTPQQSSNPVIIVLTNGGSIYPRNIYGDGITREEFIFSPYFAVGNKVKVCLQSIPQNCPLGDNRGKYYSFYDYQTKITVFGSDSWHNCGGA